MAADNKYTDKYTFDDLRALKPLTAALRNRLQLITAEADAALPKGSVAYPLDSTKVEKLIRTDPELRTYWANLTDAQRSYAYNRYVRNTPTRYDSMSVWTIDPYSSPLEHDYHRTHNPKLYTLNRAVLRGTVEAARPGINLVGNVSTLVNPVTNAVASKITGVSAPSDRHIASDALDRLSVGGYSQFKDNSVHAAVAQPTTAGQRALERSSEMLVPIAANVAAGGALSRAFSGTTAASRFAKGVGSFTANMHNPVNAIANLKVLLRDPKMLARYVRRYGVKSLFTPNSAVMLGKSGLRAADAAQDLYAMYSLAAEPAKAATNKEDNSVLKTQVDKAAYNAATTPTPTTTQPRRARLADKLNTSTVNWAASALGGGLLGLLFGGKNKLAGGLLGALLGVGGMAAYNYYKNKRS